MASVYRDPTATLKVLMGSGLLNRHLSAILKAEGLSPAGVKADMQQRISQRLRQHAANSPSGFDRLKRMIENPKELDSQNGSSPAQQNNGGAPNQHQYTPSASASARVGGAQQYGQQQGHHGIPNIEYKPSPFWQILRQMGETKECERMEGHRNSVHIQLKLTESEIADLDSTTRVMIFCAKISGPGKQDISFPQQCEIKVNGEVNRKNLRGVKNKPGSTRPLDITELLRLRPPKYPNDIELIYALTREAGVIPKYYLSLKLVKMVPVEDLAKTLASGQKITKASVVNELATNARDEDIVVGATVLSLKCPLSTLKIGLPCRATTCRHIQCFDATSYLQLQEQAPVWQCPICNNAATFENLAVDDYVREILTQTPKTVDQVTVEPDGSWSQRNNKAASPAAGGYDDDDDDDDDDDNVDVDSGSDIVEIKNSRVTALKNGTNTSSTPNSSSSFQTFSTPPGSREQSSSVGPSKSSNAKRAVIDLTSDDEDEPLSRPAKRQQYGTPNGGMQNGFPHRGGGYSH